MADRVITVPQATQIAQATKGQLNNLNERLDQLEQGGTGGAGVPTEVRQAIYTLLSHAIYDTDGLTGELSKVSSWAAEISSITLNQTSISFTNGSGTYQLVATTIPSGGAISWASSNPLVATVSRTGLVTSVANGTARITATCGDKTATCSVSVSGFVELVGIEAAYTQSGTVTDAMTLSDLIPDLVVTATYDNSSTAIITDYSLSGTLTEGVSTISVNYGGFTDIFTVNVTHVTDYEADALEGVTWTKGKEYDVDTGEIKDASNYWMSEKFTVQKWCFYNISLLGGYRTIYAWTKNGDYVGSFREYSQNGIPKIALPAEYEYVLGTSTANLSTTPTMIPVDNRETAIPTIEIDLSEYVDSITWISTNTTAELHITDILSNYGVTTSNYTQKINGFGNKTAFLGVNIQTNTVGTVKGFADDAVFSIGVYQTNINLQIKSNTYDTLQKIKDWITANSVTITINP